MQQLLWRSIAVAAWLLSSPASAGGAPPPTLRRRAESVDTVEASASGRLYTHRRRLFDFSSDCDYGETSPYYVSPTGNDWDKSGGWGLSPDRPFRTIQHAVNQRKPCQTIYVMPGTYRNNYYGKSQNHRNKVVSLSGVSDLKILAFSEFDRPVLEFDGPAAILGGSADNPVSNIEIAGLEIVGPNEGITWQDAMANRAVKRTRYQGRGIAIWAGHHIYVHDNIVHHCPASGIRVNRGDYVEISHNVVHSNTWWSSSAESAVVLAISEHIDDSDAIKMRLNYNNVYGNINKVPFYNPKYAWDYSPIGGGIKCGSYPACKAENVDGCPWQCRYGKISQDYIIDGMGVYVTRNTDTYLHGRMELANNTCYGNGVNGLVVHRTDRTDVRTNVIYDNGVVPRLDKPEPVEEDWHAGCAGKSRQPFSGLVLNNAEDVKLWGNSVAARYDDDLAFHALADGRNLAPLLAEGGNNTACRGRVDPSIDRVVAKVLDLTMCGLEKYVEVGCGERCHLIQWPYIMGASYKADEAFERCKKDCDAAQQEGSDGCGAFSLQDDYRSKESGKRRCFLYKTFVDPSPEECFSNPFNQVNGDAAPQCSYPTKNGQFFITRGIKEEYNVNDYVAPQTRL